MRLNCDRGNGNEKKEVVIRDYTKEQWKISNWVNK